jgi:hypothetical protein
MPNKTLHRMTVSLRSIAAGELDRTVDIFLTTDDRVLRIATRHTAQLKVRVANPLDWLFGNGVGELYGGAIPVAGRTRP